MKVELFTTPTCKYCHIVKDFLNKNKVEYIMHDIAKDRVNAQRLFEMTGYMSVPITLVSNGNANEIVIGSNIDRLREVLNL